MQALLENQVQLYLAGWVVGRSYVESGAIRALAVAAGQRLPGYTVADQRRRRVASIHRLELVGVSGA